MPAASLARVGARIAANKRGDTTSNNILVLLGSVFIQSKSRNLLIFGIALAWGQDISYFGFVPFSCSSLLNMALKLFEALVTHGTAAYASMIKVIIAVPLGTTQSTFTGLWLCRT